MRRLLSVCGRFVQVFSRTILQLLYGLEFSGEIAPRYNLAPSQHALVLRLNSRNGTREIARLKWGLVPAWVRDERSANKPINARAETVEQKPFFREAFRRRRALIPVSGYYEWKKEHGKKQPYLIGRKDEHPFSLAGLWERREQDGKVQETFTILTTAAAGLMTQIHERMPLIVSAESYDQWLDRNTPAAELQALLGPFSATELVVHPVSTIVNNPVNDTPQCIQPVQETTCYPPIAPDGGA